MVELGNADATKLEYLEVPPNSVRLSPKKSIFLPSRTLADDTEKGIIQNNITATRVRDINRIVLFIVYLHFEFAVGYMIS